MKTQIGICRNLKKLLHIWVPLFPDSAHSPTFYRNFLYLGLAKFRLAKERIENKYKIQKEPPFLNSLYFLVKCKYSHEFNS